MKQASGRFLLGAGVGGLAGIAGAATMGRSMINSMKRNVSRGEKLTAAIGIGGGLASLTWLATYLRDMARQRRERGTS